MSTDNNIELNPESDSNIGLTKWPFIWSRKMRVRKKGKFPKSVLLKRSVRQFKKIVFFCGFSGTTKFAQVTSLRKNLFSQIVGKS